MTDAEKIKLLRDRLEASCGYMLNAKIDLETGRTMATAVKTLDGALVIAREALKKTA